MKHKILTILFTFFLLPTFAQFTPADATKRALDDLPTKSSLNYEALTKFYQTTVTSGDDGGYNFKSSVFGIHKVFAGRRLELSSYYNDKGMFQRNTEITLGLKKDKEDRYNTFAYGLKYALVNNRDKAKVNFFTPMQQEMGTAGENYHNAVNAEIALIRAVTDSIKRSLDSIVFFSAIRKHNQSQDINDLPASIKVAVEKDWKTVQRKYDSLSKEYDNKGLLTFSFQSGYNATTKSNATTIATLQYIQGINGIDKALDIDARAIIKWEADTTTTSLDLTRSVLSCNLGFNKVLMRTSDDDPFLEVELAADYTKVLTGTVYPGEIRETKNGIAYLRVHLSKQFTIPASIKFDLEHPNAFGFLQIQWNMETKK